MKEEKGISGRKEEMDLTYYFSPPLIEYYINTPHKTLTAFLVNGNFNKELRLQESIWERSLVTAGQFFLRVNELQTPNIFCFSCGTGEARTM